MHPSTYGKKTRAKIETEGERETETLSDFESGGWWKR